MTDDGKIIKRVTTFRFDTKNDMIKAFADVTGVNIRKERHETRYTWRHFQRLDWDSRCILDILGQKYESVMDWNMVCGWESKHDIVDALYFPRDTAFDWWDRHVHITTYNLSEDQHKTEMRKLYLPMIDMGYNVSHSCETVIENVSC